MARRWNAATLRWEPTEEELIKNGARVEAERDELRRKLDERTATVARLSAELSDARETGRKAKIERGEVQRRLSLSDEAFLRVRAEATALRGEATDLRAEVAGLRGEVAERGDLLRSHRMDIGKARTELANVQGQLTIATRELEAARHVGSQAASLAADRLDALKAAEKALRNTRGDLDAAREDLRSVAETSKRRAEQITAMREQLRQAEARFHVAPAIPVPGELHALREHVKGLDAGLDKLRARLSRTGEARVKAEERAVKAERRVAELEAEAYAVAWQSAKAKARTELATTTTITADSASTSGYVYFDNRRLPADARDVKIGPRQDGKTAALYEALNAENTRLGAELKECRNKLAALDRKNAQQANLVNYFKGLSANRDAVLRDARTQLAEARAELSKLKAPIVRPAFGGPGFAGSNSNCHIGDPGCRCRTL